MKPGKNNSKHGEIPKSATKPKIPLSETQKITSPTKPPPIPKFTINPIKDFFSYTPLRQNKSLTTSVSDLKSVQSANREKQPKRRLELNNSQVLREKMRDFKAKMKRFSSPHKSDSKKLSNFATFIESLRKETKIRFSSFSFGLIKQIFNREIKIPRAIYFKSLKRKALAGIKALRDLKNKWQRVHLNKLESQCFSCLKESEDSETSFELYQIDEESECFSIDEDYKKIADLVYLNSLKQFVGMNGWKRFVLMKKRKRLLGKLGQENYLIKLMLKGFSSLIKEVSERKERPKEFRRVYTLQKVLKGWCNYEEINEKSEDIAEKYRRHKVLGKSLDSWKIYRYYVKILCSRNKASQEMIKKLNKLTSNTLS